MDGDHLMALFQCDLCIFCSLYHRNPIQVIYDAENLTTIRRMNMDDIWTIKPGTMDTNIRTMKLLISACKISGFDPQLLIFGTSPFECILVFTVAFSMLIHSI